MAKYTCQCGCDVVVDVKDGGKVPECCGKPMKKVNTAKASRRCGCCR